MWRKKKRPGRRKEGKGVVPDPPLYTVTLQFLLELLSTVFTPAMGCFASSCCTSTVRQQKEEPESEATLLGNKEAVKEHDTTDKLATIGQDVRPESR